MSFLHGHPCKWLIKALAAKSMPAVVQVLERLPCKRQVLQFMMPTLLSIPDIPQSVVELLIQSGAVPSQRKLMVAMEANVPGLRVWPGAYKNLGVPTGLSPFVDAVFFNRPPQVRLVTGTSFALCVLQNITETLLRWQEFMKPSAKDVHAIFLSAHYLYNVDSRRKGDVDGQLARKKGLHCLNKYLLHEFGELLQPDDFMLLVQWMLRTGRLYSFIIFLADPPPVELRPPTWKLLDLLELYQAHSTHALFLPLHNLLGLHPLSASELLSALERFAHHQVLVEKLSSHPAAAVISSAEVLGALQHACSTGNARHVVNLCCLPAVKALSLAELVPIMAAAAAATDGISALQSLFDLPAVKHMTTATASALLMSAISAAHGSPAPDPCHRPSADPLSVAEEAAVMWLACGARQSWSLVPFFCDLPAAQHFSPSEVAAALHSAFESVYVGTPIPDSAVSALCKLPGAKKVGVSQVQGLLEACEECAAAVMEPEDNIPEGLSLIGLKGHIMNLPAARQLCTEMEGNLQVQLEP
jgi:hypothetical protein